jgi:hypothetical protein
MRQKHSRVSNKHIQDSINKAILSFKEDNVDARLPNMSPELWASRIAFDISFSASYVSSNDVPHGTTAGEMKQLDEEAEAKKKIRARFADETRGDMVLSNLVNFRVNSLGLEQPELYDQHEVIVRSIRHILHVLDS